MSLNAVSYHRSRVTCSLYLSSCRYSVEMLPLAPMAPGTVFSLSEKHFLLSVSAAGKTYVEFAWCSLFRGHGGQCLASLRNSSSVSSFRFSDLEVVQCPEDKRHPKPDWNDLVFGAHFSDHMFEVQ